jgi:hypothetical protein
MPDPDESGGAAHSGEGTPLAVADSKRRLAEDDTESAEEGTELGSPSKRLVDDSPERADIGPDSGRPDLLDPGRDLNETVDPRATLPDGVEMPNSLVDPFTGEALDTNPNHFGVSTDRAGIDSSALDDIIGDAIAQHDGETGSGGASGGSRVSGGTFGGTKEGGSQVGGSQEGTFGGTKGGGSEEGKGSSGHGGTHPGGRNWDLVSDDYTSSGGNTKKGYLDGLLGGGKKEGPTAAEQVEKIKEKLGAGADGGTPVIPEYKDPKKMGDPDAVDPSTAPIELPDHVPGDEISKPAGVDGVEPEEPDSAPTTSDRYSKFVNPNPDDSGIDTTVAPGTAPPNPGNVDPVNPRDGIDPSPPEVPEGPGGPDVTSQALTATSDGPPTDSSVQLVDEDAGSGIQSVSPEPAPDTSAGHAVPTDPPAESDPITAATEPLMAEVTERDFEEPAFTEAPDEFDVEGDTPDFDGDGVPG